jgi:hypothetical protein
MSARCRRAPLAWLVFLAAGLSIAQNKPHTDAQDDLLAGPVRSVMTIVRNYDVHWRQPNGPALVWPVFCRVCDYDPDGTRTKAGEMGQDGFAGENLTIDRDGKGKVIARHATDAITGELLLEEVVGSYGDTQRMHYIDGVLSSSESLQYDENGNVTEVLSRDAKGNLTCIRRGSSGSIRLPLLVLMRVGVVANTSDDEAGEAVH